MWNWKSITVDEILLSWHFSYWWDSSEACIEILFSEDSVLATPIFSSFISMDQFESKYKFIHFSNNE
jgi:hypothetical protein